MPPQARSAYASIASSRYRLERRQTGGNIAELIVGGIHPLKIATCIVRALQGLEAGVDYFIGGNVYPVSEAIAQELFVFGLSDEGRRELERVVSTDFSKAQVAVKLASASSDLVFLARDGRVVKTAAGVPPWRIRAAWRAFAVVELPSGSRVVDAVRSAIGMSSTVSVTSMPPNTGLNS